MEKLRVHDIALINCSKREGVATFCADNCQGTHGHNRSPLGRQSFHPISDSDFAMDLVCLQSADNLVVHHDAD